MGNLHSVTWLLCYGSSTGQSPLGYLASVLWFFSENPQKNGESLFFFFLCSQCVLPVPFFLFYVLSVLIFTKKKHPFFFPPIFSFILSLFFQKETFLSHTKKICHFPFSEILVMFIPKYMAVCFLMPQKAKKYDLEHL